MDKISNLGRGTLEWINQVKDENLRRYLQFRYIDFKSRQDDLLTNLIRSEKTLESVERKRARRKDLKRAWGF
ncbi:MAG: hypothetical protein DRZ76_01885 [Candidatus Nealsonbacteria bacterium]|nr:MAG: hypothetical protein DRZ76_01885 [Candidatus Nealsonbacteria bacterium]